MTTAVRLSGVACAALLMCTVSADHALRLRGVPRELAIRNNPESATISGGGTLHLSARGGTNLFKSPGGNYSVVDAPMAVFEPDSSFVFTAKVTADLKNVYDVAALVIYENENWWAKLCYEYSAEKQPTIVSVVTHEISDDTNSSTVPAKPVFLAVAKKGDEMSFHYSEDGKAWHLVRHFRMAFKAGASLGFAVHGSRGGGFSASFSDVTYSPQAPQNMRQLALPAGR